MKRRRDVQWVFIDRVGRLRKWHGGLLSNPMPFRVSQQLSHPKKRIYGKILHVVQRLFSHKRNLADWDSDYRAASIDWFAHVGKQLSIGQ